MTDRSTLVPAGEWVCAGCLVRADVDLYAADGTHRQVRGAVIRWPDDDSFTLANWDETGHDEWRWAQVLTEDLTSVQADLACPLTAARAAGWLVGAEVAVWAWATEATSARVFLSVSGDLPWQEGWGQGEWTGDDVPALADPDVTPAEALAAVVRWRMEGDHGQ